MLALVRARSAIGCWPERCGARGVGAVVWHGLWTAVCLALVCLVFGPLGLAGVPAFAKDPLDVRVETGPGYTRFIMSWPERLGEADLGLNHTLDHRVAVVRFSRPVAFDAEIFVEGAADVVAAARIDAKGDALRLALRRDPQIVTSRSYNVIALDFVDEGATPPPPVVSPRELAEQEALARRRLQEAQGGVVSEGGVVVPELDVAVSFAQSALYTRIMFEWSDALDFSSVPGAGELTLNFVARGEADLSQLNADAPRGLERAVWWTGDLGSGVELVLSPGVESRVWSDEGRIVADLIWPQESAARAVPQVVAAPVDDGEDEEAGVEGDSSGDGDGSGYGTFREGIDVTGVAQSELLTSRVAMPAVSPNARLVARVGTVSGTTEAVVNWPVPVGAAAFRRGDAVWWVFDAAANIDIGALRGITGVADAVVQKGPDYLAIRMVVDPTLKPALDSSDGGRQWTLTLSLDARLPERRLGAVVRAAGPTRGWVGVDLQEGRRALLVNDPVVGDRVIVVTAMGPSAGVISSKSFAQLSLHASAHGVAITPLVDALDVTVAPDQVTIGDKRVLAVTANVVVNAGTRGATARATASPAFVDFDTWAQGDRDFFDVRSELVNAMVMAEDMGPPGIELVRFLVGREYAAEAVGALELLIEDRPQYAYDLRVASLHGAALAMMGRWEDAEEALSPPSLSSSPSASLWRGYIAANQADWDKAALEFQRGDPALYGYAPRWRGRFLSAKARAAVELGDFDGAKQLADEVLGLPVTEAVKRDALLVLALVHKERGEYDAAIAGFRSAVPDVDVPQAAYGQYLLTKAEREAGLISAQEARDRYEGLYFRWRGDGLEILLTDALARDALDSGEVGRGLRLMRERLQRFPDHPDRRDLSIELSQRFEDLFLNGGVDSYDPIEALALWYEFRDLTPPGTTGDRMIRRLADRLVDVDLLPQAAELLDYQISQRLEGPARAVVATDLATVHLLDRNPQEALMVLASTRFAQLPDEVIRERRLVQARALAEMGRSEAALDLLQTDRTPDASRLRAAIAWNTRDWYNAAPFILEGIGSSWKGITPIPEQVETDVLRAAVAMTLSGDERALAQLVEDYGDAMAMGAQSSAWALVATTPDVTGASLRDIAGRLADEATLDKFVEDVRARRIDLPD